MTSEKPSLRERLENRFLEKAEAWEAKKRAEQEAREKEAEASGKPVKKSRPPDFRRMVLTRLAVLFGLAAAVVLGLMFAWSREPREFDVMKEARAMALANGHIQRADQELPPGYVTVATLIRVVETLLDRSGGYLSNDVAPPSIWLDNLPNWEYGVLLQVREFTSALRQDFSRSRAQSAEAQELVEAEARFSYEHTAWVLPSAEAEYHQGLDHLRTYLDRLAAREVGGATFTVRPDTLAAWLRRVERRLGAQTIRLRANVTAYTYDPNQSQNLVLPMMTTPEAPSPDAPSRAPPDQAATPPETDQAMPVNPQLQVSSDATPQKLTPWMKVDDIFFEARGTAWATYHLLKAIRYDFGALLVMQQSLGSMNRALSELHAAIQPIRSPMILNGNEFGVTPNHSLALAAYMAKAHLAIADLRALTGGNASLERPRGLPGGGLNPQIARGAVISPSRRLRPIPVKSLA